MITSEPLECFAVSPPGLERIVSGELAALGIEVNAEPGGVAWTGSTRDLYAANLHLRTASRVLVRAARFRARSFIELERHARRVNWTPFLEPGAPVRLRVTSRKSRLYHEGAIAERFTRFIHEAAGGIVTTTHSRPEDGDADAGSDPDAGIVTPDTGQLFVIRFLRDECLVSVDASGKILHRRGYRQALAKAPLRENLAAGMLIATGWDGSTPLVDPFCGSGTIPIEGALIARRIAPGIASPEFKPRDFAFAGWPSARPELWARLVSDARSVIRDRAPHPIIGSDRDTGAISAAHANAARAGVTNDTTFELRPLSAATPPDNCPAGVIVTNPPYGVRIGEAAPLRNLYATLGNLVRTRFAGWRLTMITADDGLERQTGLALEELLRTRNGGIPVRVVGGR
jgi:putative N6-adenine-specific DNA methylase